MPKKPKDTIRPPRPLREDGKAPRNPPENFVAFAIDSLYDHTSTTTMHELMKTFGMSRRNAWRVIAEAQLRIADDSVADVANLRATLTLRASRIADKAENASQYQAAVAAIRAIAKLNGLEVQLVNVGATTPEQQAMINALVLTPHQRRKRIAEIKTQVVSAVPSTLDEDDADD